MAGTSRSDHFRIIDDIYYDRNERPCVLFADDTIRSHLIDTALEQSSAPAREHVVSASKCPTSGSSSPAIHFDHVAGHADMKAASGAQVFASAADAMVLERRKEGLPSDRGLQAVKVDRIIKDKDNVKLGSGHSPHLTPGHTEGNTTWTTTINENGKKLNVVFAGSMSINRECA